VAIWNSSVSQQMNDCFMVVEASLYRRWRFAALLAMGIGEAGEGNAG
jgi:hypothetical protein